MILFILLKNPQFLPDADPTPLHAGRVLIAVILVGSLHDRKHQQSQAGQALGTGIFEMAGFDGRGVFVGVRLHKYY